jgi:hypothetical protein
LKAALVASGYGDAHVKLYLEKLVSRRDQMICDLRLDHEIPPLRPAGVKFNFTYDPAVDGSIISAVNSDKSVTARPTPYSVQHGKLVLTPQNSQ